MLGRRVFHSVRCASISAVVVDVNCGTAIRPVVEAWDSERGHADCLLLWIECAEAGGLLSWPLLPCYAVANGCHSCVRAFGVHDRGSLLRVGLRAIGCLGAEGARVSRLHA